MQLAKPAAILPWLCLIKLLPWERYRRGHCQGVSQRLGTLPVLNQFRPGHMTLSTPGEICKILDDWCVVNNKLWDLEPTGRAGYHFWGGIRHRLWNNVFASQNKDWSYKACQIFREMHLLAGKGSCPVSSDQNCVVLHSEQWFSS